MLNGIDERVAHIEQTKQKILELLKIEEKDLLYGARKRLKYWHTIPMRAGTLKELRVAAIMDPFTLECFRPECSLTELTPGGWRQEMEEAQPDLLFIESAWQGKDKLWYGKINKCAPELRELADYCHERKIPVVFWSKEDPIHNATFMPTVSLADVVFTTDIECIETYKTKLGHNNVYHLHFGAQPLIHNPIEKFKRKDMFCFAGSYYHRYEKRCKTFDAFADYFIDTRGFDIYDRNYPKPLPQYRFPERYDPYILGRLDPSEIDIAYKGYTFGVNMNSIIHSQSMFARRVFELMASNTIVIGNFSRGVKNYFGDLTICTDDVKTMRTALERSCGRRESAEKLRLLALRKVLREHLCEDRLDFVVQKVFGRSLKAPLPSVCVLARAENQTQADHAVAMFQKQSYERKTMVLVCGGAISVPEEIRGVSQEDAAGHPLLELCQADYLAYFAPEDWYGENYLLDLALAARYGDFTAMGKAEYLEAGKCGTVRRGEGGAYHIVGELAARRSMLRSDRLSELTVEDLRDDAVWRGENMMSCDVLNYCAGWEEAECPAAADMVMRDQGIPLERILKTAEKISALPVSLDSREIGAEAIAQMETSPRDPVRVQLREGKAVLTSKLPDKLYRYLYLKDQIPLGLLTQDGTLAVTFYGTGKLNLICCCVFYDANGSKLGAGFPRLGKAAVLEVPEGAAFIRLAYRPSGPGQATLSRIVLGGGCSGGPRGGCFLSRSNVLVLTNFYPAPDDLYKHMFVHKRLASYKEQGLLTDVVLLRPGVENTFREFEGINVLEGSGEMLESILSSGSIDTVCVHFLDRSMWNILKQYLSSVRVIVWCHGSDIQPWWRRRYNYKTKSELDEAKRKSDQRMELWREAFDAAENSNIHFVFVSQYLADEVMEDYRRTLPSKRYSVIHNLVDTDMFQYVEKDAEKRKTILSIKSFAGPTYGNDITAKAILALSKRPCFSDLQFLICGDGPDFEQENAPLRAFKNVKLVQGFLTQREIAELHRKAGVFIATTRMDSQGVSRGEAMSSGLVPIANAVAAIPEFVDDTCGILVPAEDWQAVADGIEKLYEDPELFLRLSRNAAARVRRQTAKEFTIDKEILEIDSGESAD